jgi:putative membrane protein
MVGSPTDHLANERTFLAWIRTALTIIGLGFVVAKFGLFLRELATRSPGPSSSTSEYVGVFLILAGSALVGIAYNRFRLTHDDLQSGTYTPRTGMELLMTGTLVAVGITLAAYLIVTG